MKLKTEDLTGEALNWAVAEKLDRRPLVAPAQYQVPARVFAVVPGCERVERFDLADGATAWATLTAAGRELAPLEQDGSMWASMNESEGYRAWVHPLPHICLGRAVLGAGTWDIPDELLAP